MFETIHKPCFWNSKIRGKLCINNIDVECILPDDAAPDEIQVHWAAISATQLIYRTTLGPKRMNNFFEILPQLKTLYKDLWATDDIPAVLRSRHTQKNRGDDQNRPSLSMFTTRTMIPTSFLVTMLIWGIHRARRPVEDVNRTTENFMALWSLTFSMVREHKCRVERSDGACFGFAINPNAQAPFLHCMFSEEYLEQLDADWRSLYRSWLVVWNMFLFFHRLEIMNLTDWLIFFVGVETTNQEVDPVQSGCLQTVSCELQWWK